MSKARSSHVERSTLVGAGHATLDALRRAAASSRLADAVRTLAEANRESRSTALLDRTADELDHWLRGSALYRWLTAEPDPDVIVVDLRETYTVGPLVAVAERLREPAERTFDASQILRALDSASAVFADSRVARLLATAFAPPPSLDERTNDEATPDDRANERPTNDDHTADDRS